jgi:hypothetical protein
MGNLKKAKRQYIELLTFELSENYSIPYKEAKHAVSLSRFNEDMESYNEDDLRNLSSKGTNNIVNEIWNDYKDLCFV